MTVTPASVGLNSTQLKWAEKVVAEVKALKFPLRAAQIAIDVCLTESSLLMYANGNNSRSLQLPHDAVGWDHGSVGLFQQQVGGAVNSTANWGTTDQLMNAATSTQKFISALSRHSWQSMTDWAAAQAVQGSFDPTGGNYRLNDAHAVHIGTALWGGTAPTPKPPVTQSGTTHKVVSGDSLSGIASKYKVTVAQLVSWNRTKYPTLATNPNLIKIGWVLVVKPTIVSTKPPATVATMYTIKSGDSLSSIAARYKTTWQQLVSWNKAKYPALQNNPNLIQVGWSIRVH